MPPRFGLPLSAALKNAAAGRRTSVRFPDLKTECILIIFAIFVLFTSTASAQTPPPPLLLSNITQIWDVTGAPGLQPQRIKTEVIIYYFDPDWNCAFGESLGRKTFLPITDCPEPLKAGQRVSIDGEVLPARQHFLWDKTRVQILESNVAPNPIAVANVSDSPKSIQGHLISLDALVSETKFPTAGHLEMQVLNSNVMVRVFIPASSNTPLSFKAGNFVRLKGVFAPTFDRNGDLESSTLWVPAPADVSVTGTLDTDPRFVLPVTPVEKIFNDPHPNAMVRVVGTVRNHKPGRELTLWDDTGQITIQSKQIQPLQFDDRIEAAGYPVVAGVQATLRDALYHVLSKSSQTNAPGKATPFHEPLRLAAQIQYLASSDVSRQPPVNLRGVLMWSHGETPFVYILDASGGVRVMNPTWQDTNLSPGTIVIVHGNVTEGAYVPVVTNAVIIRDGWRGIDPAQPISFEQAMTGVDDGQWVELNGLVRQAVHAGGLTRLNVATSRGEFEAWVPSFPGSDALTNTLVRLDGICSAVANSRRQLTGIQLWVPNQFSIFINQTETTNIFGVDFRPLGNLRRFNVQNELNERIKTAGTVVLQQAGRYLYLQDGQDAIFALSRQEDHLTPGDQIEISGFPGHEGGRFLLREAVFRRLGDGIEPAPILLPSNETATASLDGLMAKAQGVLLNIARKDNRVRLLIGTGHSVFEAAIESENPASLVQFLAVPVGSRLDLTGVYEIQNDEYNRPSSFQLLLRSYNDLKILSRPPWWSWSRLLAALIVILGGFIISILWGLSMSKKNRLLDNTRQQLEITNGELESFSYSVSHDLRAPLRSIDGFSRILLEEAAQKLDDNSKANLQRVRAASQRMGRLIDDLLKLSRVTRTELHRAPVNLSALANETVHELNRSEPERQVELVIEPRLRTIGDSNLLRIVIDNLIGNAWKFTSRRPDAKIEFGRITEKNETVFFIRDNGAGFDMNYVGKLFGAFQRLHSNTDFPGTGVGLATVQRIIHRHGGRIWATSELNIGTTFYFTLGHPPTTKQEVQSTRRNPDNKPSQGNP